MKNFIKKYSTQLIVVLVILLILEIVFGLVLKAYPFKTANILISDLYFAYVPFFNYMRDAIINGRSIFVSLSFTMGQSIIGIVSYFCLSPLNLLFLFTDISNITYATKILIFIKIILCGLNMSIYLNNKTDKLKNILLSLIYAFMAYNIRFAFNVMWLDVVYMLPLVILGLEKLIEGKSKKLYIITLTIMMFSNFYISFSACIFIAIYFFFYSIAKKKLTWKLFWKFVYSSLIAVLLNAVMLIPTIFNMLDGKAIAATKNYDRFILYNPLDVIYNFTPGTTAGYVLVDLPYFYSSTLILVLFINYLLNKEISYKERYMAFFIAAFLIFSTLIAPLDLLFHCFRVPNSLYYRFIYILPFFFISTVSRHKVKISWWSLIPIAILIGWAFSREVSIKMAIFAFLLLSYFFLAKLKFKYLVFILAICEMFYNLFYSVKIYIGFKGYDDLYEYNEALQEYKPKENEFYRMELANPIAVNDSFVLGYYGINSFSPTISNSSKIFLKDYMLYAEQHTLNYIYQNRFVLDPYFLGVKYDMIDNQVRENEYYLPLIIKSKSLDYFEPTNLLIENSNNLYNMINGEYLFKEVEFEIDCIKERYVIKESCNITYDRDETKSYYLEIYTDGGDLSNRAYIENNNIIEVENSFNLDKDHVFVRSAKLYEFDKNAIKNQTLEFDVFKDDYMRLNIKKGLYFMTVPYDEGWHIKINGKEIKKIKVLDSLIGFEAEEGVLEAEFIPQGLILGTIISGVTFIVIFAYYVRKRLM